MQINRIYPFRVLYILAVIALGIIAFAFVWYIQYLVFSTVSTTGASIMTSLETTSSTSDSVATFLSNGTSYLIILALIGLAIWVWQYSQRRGQQV